VEQRVAELKANPGELEAVIHQTVELFQATDIIVATPGFQCSTKEPGGSCTEAYKNLTQRMIHQVRMPMHHSLQTNFQPPITTHHHPLLDLAYNTRACTWT